MEASINKLIQDEKELTRQGVVLDFVKNKVDSLDKKFDSLRDSLDTKYVTHEEYDLYKRAITDDVLAPIIKDVAAINANIRWVVLFVITAVLGAIISLVIIK